MTNTQYTSTAKILHWLVAGLIVLQFVLAKLAENTDSAVRELALLANHKSVGITILVLALVRILWRFRNKPPALPASMPRWQVLSSHISHWSLYALLFLIPLSGWLMSSASAYSVSWFNLIQLPDFVAPNPELKETLEEIHEFLANLLAAIALLHIAAALKHAIIDKDGVLSRMSSAATVALFAAVIVLGVYTLGLPGKQAPAATSSTSNAATAASAADEPVASSTLPVWNIDYEASFIHFTGDQAGAEFDGVWQDWDAKLQFSPDDLAGSRFDVTIRTAAVETQDDDRDATLSDPEWFDPKNFPEAHYRASRFSDNGNGEFVAHGQLSIKDNAAPVDLVFKVDSSGNERVLTGSAELLRLDLGVGTGEWEDTDWVGNEVSVEVRVTASLP